MRWIARRTKDGREQGLIDHLHAVANRSRQFGNKFGLGNTCWGCGISHDIGKGTMTWYETRLNANKKCSHSPIAAKVIINESKNTIAAIVNYSHHGKLISLTDLDDFLQVSFNPDDVKQATALFKELSPFNPTDTEVSDFINSRHSILVDEDKIDNGMFQMLLIRMVLSTVVDADRLDARRVELGEEIDQPQSMDILCEEFYSAYSEITTQMADAPLNTIRSNVFQDAIAFSGHPQGVFILSTPTGTGKTFASLGFCLNHAKKWSLDRVITVVPYLTLTDQISMVYRSVIDSNSICEDHSLAPIGGDNQDVYSFNWGSPIVITTAVQFFESLFSASASSVRKLHNISKSMIYIDEIQCVPPEKMLYCFWAIQELVNKYGCSCCLTSATQPLLSEVLNRNDLDPIEIGPPGLNVPNHIRKVHVQYSPNMTYSKLLDSVANNNNSLVALNTKKKAAKMYLRLSERFSDAHIYHLSAYMTPQHRQSHLGEIQNLLNRKQKCLVASTQVVDVGRDLDFMNVNRELSPLDRIGQGIGRTNRHGLYENALYNVFDFEDESERSCPRGYYYKGMQISKSILAENKNNDLFGLLTDQPVYRDYYNRLFENGLRSARLDDAITDGDFKQVAKSFQFITPQCQILIHQLNPAFVDSIIEKIQQGQLLSKYEVMQAQNISVSAFDASVQKFEENGWVFEIIPYLWVWTHRYDPHLGLSWILLEGD